MVDLLHEFLMETHENLTRLDNAMLALERDPLQTDFLAQAFRALHTIKGSCGFLKLPHLEKVAHDGEWILGHFRDHAAPVTPQAVRLILMIADIIRVTADTLRHTRAEPDDDHASLHAAVGALMASDDKNILPAATRALTAQEPYSLAMLIRQDDALRDWTVDIVATDLSHEAIRRAQSGVFSHFEAQRGLPIGYLMRFFTRHDQDWHIEDPIKRMVSFRTRNMLDDFSDLGSFDIVFCRNVLIYIDAALKDDIVTRLHRVVRPHGYLVLGAVEAYLNNASWQDQAAITGIFRRL